MAETRRSRAPQIRLLVVDDDPHAREAMLGDLKAVGYHAVGAADGLQALQQLQREPFDVVLTDIQMPRLDGIALLREIRRQGYAVRVVFQTTLLNTSLTETLRRAGAADVVTKGEPMAALARAIEGAARTPSAP